MENAEIAKVLYEIGDLLEIRGKKEDQFRIRSYRNAALVVEGYPESFKTLVERGEKLEGIPGIGTSIRDKIIELVKTGKCKAHQDLLKEIPQGMLEFLKISSVGPRKAAQFFKELHIASVDELEKAAREHRLHELPGMGEKSEQKILKGIEDFKAVSGRVKLSVAVPIAEGFVSYLKKVPGVIEVVPAGSFRRWKETIGDLDILTTCKDPKAVMEAFVKHPDVKEVLAKGETKSTVVLKNGLQVDVRTLEEKAFGAALQYFTGSKTHNIELRDRAKKLGLKISEYGVFKEEKGKEKWVAGYTEEEVYKLVGLPWIPPELRENKGEIEAADRKKLPELLEVKDIRGDLHMHTKESDGGNTLEQMAEAAMKLRYEYIAVTDHSKAIGIAHGLDEKRVLEEIKEIDAFNRKLEKKGKKFRVLRGAEVDIRADGTLDHPERVLEKLDCVVAAVHSGFTMPEKEMTERVIKAMRTGRVHVLAHPTGRLIGEREPYAIDMEKVLIEAKKNGVALELNSYPDRLDLNDVHLKLAKEKGVPVVISTDAHSTLHLHYMRFGVHTARRGWLEKGDVLNTRTLKELMKFLRREK